MVLPEESSAMYTPPLVAPGDHLAVRAKPIKFPSTSLPVVTEAEDVSND